MEPAITGKGKKILSRFPSFMRLNNSGKALGKTCSVLGRGIDELERQAKRIQNSHRIEYAPEQIDVYRLGALLGLESPDFMLLRKMYEKGYFALTLAGGETPGQAHFEKEYREYVKSLGNWVIRHSDIVMEGCGTIWALLEGCSLLLNAQTITPATGPRIQTVDKDPNFGGFVHRIPIVYKTLEGDKWEPKEDFIYLVENPIFEKSSQQKEVWQRGRIEVQRHGFFHGRVTSYITGVANRTVKPRIVNLETQEGVGYNGIVEDGQELIFAQDGMVYLDGINVTEDCYFFKGGLYSDAPTAFWDPNSEDSAEELAKKDQVTVTPEHAMDRNFPRPAITPLSELPVLRLKLDKSGWQFSVEEGAYSASAFDECVFAFPKEESKIKELPSSAKLELKWKEHTAFAATLLIPKGFQNYETQLLKGGDLKNLVLKGLEKYRPAGIKLEVEYYESEWLLGKSLLEDLTEIDGVGVDVNNMNIS